MSIWPIIAKGNSKCVELDFMHSIFHVVARFWLDQADESYVVVLLGGNDTVSKEEWWYACEFGDCLVIKERLQ
jgi:hypothetical protein